MGCNERYRDRDIRFLFQKLADEEEYEVEIPMGGIFRIGISRRMRNH